MSSVNSQAKMFIPLIFIISELNFILRSDSFTLWNYVLTNDMSEVWTSHTLIYVAKNIIIQMCKERQCIKQPFLRRLYWSSAHHRRYTRVQRDAESSSLVWRYTKNMSEVLVWQAFWGCANSMHNTRWTAQYQLSAHGLPLSQKRVALSCVII